MYIYRDNIKKVREEDELFRDLHKHCGVLDDGIIRYLEALINLELNVVREGISTNDREILSQLNLFRDISTYNIYHISKKIITDLLDHHKLLYTMKDNDNEVPGVRAYLKSYGRNFQIFDFDYSGRINEISLFKVEANHKHDDKYVDELMKKTLEQYYNEKNPYPVSDEKVHFAWEEEHMKKIIEFQDFISENRTLTNEDKKDIEISRKIYEYLLSEFGLEDDEFKEVESISDFQKTYVKQMPGLNIKKNINYI